MAALNFPSSPTNGQTYTDNGVTFVYNSTVGAWEGSISSGGGGGGGGSSVTVSDTAPTSPSEGDIWFDSTDGRLYTYYDSSWIEVSGSSLTLPDDKSMTVAVSDEVTALTTGTSKLTFRAPHAMTLTDIPRISLGTAASTGTTSVNIDVDGSSIFSTVITIPATFTTSVGQTPAVLTTTSIADDAVITVDIDGVGTGAKGLKLTLYYRRTV